MNKNERWGYLVELDEELLKGGIILSEWCSCIVRETDLAFVNGANLASILTAVAGIETYFRSEYAEVKRSRLYDLIEHSPIDKSLKENLHILRKYRNKWMHVDEPWEDGQLLSNPEDIEQELEGMAKRAVYLLRLTIYENPCV